MTLYFKWKEDMSVGEVNIDHQHEQLLEQLNKVIDSMVFGVKSKEAKEAIDFFDKYFKEHFSYEEEYMSKHNYPEIIEHKKKHQEFIDKYLIFKEKLDKGVNESNLITEIEIYLGKWWIEHIGIEDQKYHFYINKNKF